MPSAPFMSQAERRRLARKGQALPDLSFPIPDVDHLKRAIRAYGRSKNPTRVRAFIRRRAAALGATDLIPLSWN